MKWKYHECEAVLYPLRDWPPTNDILGIKTSLLEESVSIMRNKKPRKKGNDILDFSSVPRFNGCSTDG